ncbi:MAG: hypothetical protein CMJ59_15225 [Planctomycetaceae bacterium]|nr:hypothetical protein [Planctomycetaceae bacterium]
MRHLLTLWLLLVVTGPALSADKPTARELAFFEKKIRPLLVQHCYKCHSRQAKTVEAGLLLDSRQGWMTGGENGAVIAAGSPGESLLIQAVNYEGLEMPPKEKLSPQQIADLTRWVRQGAPDPRTGDSISPIRRTIDIDQGRTFWAFHPALAAPLPPVENPAWPLDAIDHFILAGIEAAGLAPVGDADRRTLVRRLYFDLVGLPPTQQQVDDFVHDKSSRAVETLVDELLESPHFGERWGRHWLDVARYAESTGMERNFTFPHAWRYRDYVIDAFNRDLPYNRFITEQVAGDLLPAKTAADRNRLTVATGFLAMGPKSLNEPNPKVFQMDVVDDQVDISTRAVLALTVSCARCHDHKFDPFPTEDYYAIAGIFRSTRTLFGTGKGQGNRRATGLVSLASSAPKEATPSPAADQKTAQITKLTEQLRKARRELRKLQGPPKGKKKGKKKSNKKANKKAPSKTAATPQQLKQLRNRVRRLNRKLKQARGGGQGNTKPTGPVAMGVQDGAPEDCRVHIRGNVKTLGKRVPRGFPQVVHLDSVPGVNGSQSGRLEFAAWLTSAENPLTARVMANRVWYHLTGRGLVTTLDNFGAMGQRPSHPELLDHLALDFIENNWSVKSLIRKIVLSRTYRLASTPYPANRTKDPDNTRFWRMNHRRLDAEAIRDAILAVSGQLETAPPKRSVVADIGDANVGRAGGTLTKLNAPSRYRSVYLPIVRNAVPEMLRLFDFAEPSMLVGRRDVTTVPAQALFLLNSPFMLAQADRLAARVVAAAADEAGRVEMAYRMTLNREPTDGESTAAIALVTAHLTSLPGQNTDGDRQQAWSGLCQALLACAEFRYLQ